MKLSREQVRHVAALAHLGLTEEEEARVQEQLSAILEAMEMLRELDTADVEPTSHAVSEVAGWREDEVRPSLLPEESLGNAPARVGTSFAVPRILE
jgi:aspartyl-tRNA(Asn)/glutamyl-tRNA(Gln) amidotransferase subunit C